MGQDGRKVIRMAKPQLEGRKLMVQVRDEQKDQEIEFGRMAGEFFMLLHKAMDYHGDLSMRRPSGFFQFTWTIKIKDNKYGGQYCVEDQYFDAMQSTGSSHQALIGRITERWKYEATVMTEYSKKD